MRERERQTARQRGRERYRQTETEAETEAEREVSGLFDLSLVKKKQKTPNKQKDQVEIF